MNVNDSGDLVPDPVCVTSESVVVPSPSQSAQPDPGFSRERSSVGVTVAIAIAILVAAFIVLAICLVLVVKLRRMHKKKKQVVKTSMSSFPSSKSKDSLRYHDANDANLLRPVAESSTRVARVPSAYIRQMADEKLLIPGRSLTLMDTIGQGEFGVVYRGNLGGWRAEREHSVVAIKTLKGIFSTNDLSNMVEESVKMAKFNHPNVMRLIGVCIDKGASPYIVMPYMAYGSLLSYLKKQRAELTLANNEDQELD
jgi:hypothetical protein